MVGFNRRFAPQVQKMKSLLDTVSAPKAMSNDYKCWCEITNDHWTQDLEGWWRAHYR
jgi:predicted dehydrogenase